MRHERFIEMVDSRLAQVTKTLDAKCEEYASGQDRLHNFKHAAALQGITPAEALRGMWAKHIVSIMKMIADQAGGGLPSPELVAEKLGDNIAYTLLYEAVIEEEREGQEEITEAPF